MIKMPKSDVLAIVSRNNHPTQFHDLFAVGMSSPRYTALISAMPFGEGVPKYATLILE